MGVGAIPFEAIDVYARIQGYSADEREELFFHVRKMDSVYLEHVGNAK